MTVCAGTTGDDEKKLKKLGFFGELCYIPPRNKMLFTPPPPRNSAQTRVDALVCVIAVLLTFFLAGSETAQSSPVIPAKAGIHTNGINPPSIFDGGGVNLLVAFSELGEWKRAELRRLLGAAENRAGTVIGDAAVSRFHFVKKARVDFQTSLGGRKGQFAIDAIGSLREREDDALGWHLRGYAGEENARGGNAGLFWRFAKAESLFGANAFLDYERDDNAGGFWRWSVGAEWKNKYGELSANRYWRITEGKQQTDGYYYTREGFDADVYLRAPGLEWAALRGGYYRWEGERGDNDDEGLRYGLRLSPGGGIFVEAEYDEDSGDFGGSFSYSHTFGEASSGAEKADGFNPRLHFYDSARREYSQRISRAGAGVSQFAAVLVSSNLQVSIGSSVTSAVVAASPESINYPFALTADVTVSTGATPASGNAFVRQQAEGWNLTLNADSQIAILQSAQVLSVAAGGGEFERFGSNRLQTVIMPGATVRLLGTRFAWAIGGGETKITLREGGVSVVGSGAALAMDIAAGANALIGGENVGCGAGQTVREGNVRAHCALARAARDAPASGAAATVLPGDAPLAVGSVLLAAAGENVSAAVSPDGIYEIVTVQNTVLVVRMIAEPANFGDIPAQVQTGGDLQTSSAFDFPVRFSPHPLTIAFAETPNLSRLTSAADITVGTVTVTGGDDARAARISGGANFNLNGAVLLLRAAAANATGEYAVTLAADDNNADTPAVFLTATVRVAEGVNLPPPGAFAGKVLTVTTHAAANAIATLAAAGGSGFSYALVRAPANVTVAADANNGALSFSQTPTNPLTVALTAMASGTGLSGNSESATALLTLAIVDPPQLTIGFAPPGGTFVFATMEANATVGNIAVSGGQGAFARAFAGSPTAGFALAADGELFFADAENAGALSATVVANDAHANTEPATLIVEVRVLDGIALLRPAEFANPLTVTTRAANAFIAQLTAAGGSGFRYGLLNPTAGVFASANGALRFSQIPASPFTVALTATASGTNLAGNAQAATIVLTLAAVLPPELTLDIHPARGDFLFSVAAGTVAVATIRGGGGFNRGAVSGDFSGGVFALTARGGDIVLLATNFRQTGFYSVTLRVEDGYTPPQNAMLPVTATVIRPLVFRPIFVGGVEVAEFTVTSQVATPGAVTLSASGGFLAAGENYTFTDIENDVGISFDSANTVFNVHTGRAHGNGVPLAVRAEDSIGNRAIARVTVLHLDPPALTVTRGSLRTVAITSAELIAFGNPAVSGGVPPYSYAIINGTVANEITAQIGAGDGILSIAFPVAADEVTVTVEVDDNHSGVSPATLELTLSVNAGIALSLPDVFAGGALTVTTQIANSVIATLSASGGGDAPDFRYGFAGSAPTFALTAESGRAILRFNGIPDEAGEWPVTITASGLNAVDARQNARLTLTVAAADPPELLPDFVGEPNTVLLTAAAATVGTVSVSGGANPNAPGFAGGEANGFVFANNSVLILANAGNATTVTATIRARDDSHSNVDDAFLTVSLTVVSGVSLTLSEFKTETVLTGARVTVVTLTPSGGFVGGQNYVYSGASGLGTAPDGMNVRAADGALLIRIDSPETITNTIVVDDRFDASLPASLTLTVTAIETCGFVQGCTALGFPGDVYPALTLATMMVNAGANANSNLIPASNVNWSPLAYFAANQIFGNVAPITAFFSFLESHGANVNFRNVGGFRDGQTALDSVNLNGNAGQSPAMRTWLLANGGRCIRRCFVGHTDINGQVCTADTNAAAGDPDPNCRP